MRSGGEDRLLWENVWQGGRGFLLLVISCALYAGLLFMTEGKARFLLPFLLFFPALEDRRTGYISDGWSALLLLCGLLTSYEAGMIYFAMLSFQRRLRAAFSLCFAWRPAEARGREIYFWPLRLHPGFLRWERSVSSGRRRLRARSFPCLF